MPAKPIPVAPRRAPRSVRKALPVSDKPTINIFNVSSSGPSSGTNIGQQNNYYGQPQRRLGDDHRKYLGTTSPPGSQSCSRQPRETAGTTGSLMYEIQEYLLSVGYKMGGVGQITFGGPPPRGVVIRSPKENPSGIWSVYVGPPP